MIQYNQLSTQRLLEASQFSSLVVPKIVNIASMFTIVIMWSEWCRSTSSSREWFRLLGGSFTIVGMSYHDPFEITPSVVLRHLCIHAIFSCVSSCFEILFSLQTMDDFICLVYLIALLASFGTLPFEEAVHELSQEKNWFVRTFVFFFSFFLGGDGDLDSNPYC